MGRKIIPNGGGFEHIEPVHCDLGYIPTIKHYQDFGINILSQLCIRFFGIPNTACLAKDLPFQFGELLYDGSLHGTFENLGLLQMNGKN